MRKIFRSSNNTIIYLVALLIIVVAFFLLGGDTWFKGAMHGGSGSLGTLQWGQIVIALIIGFILGYVFARKR